MKTTLTSRDTPRRQFIASTTLTSTGAAFLGVRPGSLTAAEPGGAPASGPAPAQPDRVRVYPAPVGEPLSKDFTVTVENKNVPVYLARVRSLTVEERRNNRGSDTSLTAFASFDIQDKVQVSVTVPTSVQSAKLLPSSRGIKLGVAGNTITFTIPKPAQYVL